MDIKNNLNVLYRGANKSTQAAKTDSDMMAEIGDILRNAPN